eukprot:1334747-Pyramimonas_sp.AAC.1
MLARLTNVGYRLPAPAMYASFRKIVTWKIVTTLKTFFLDCAASFPGPPAGGSPPRRLDSLGRT